MTNEKAIHILMHLADHVEEIDGRIGIDGALMDATLLAIKALRSQKRGYWIDYCTSIVCSECKTSYSDEIVLMSRDFEHEELNYCPNCGAQVISEG